MLRKGWKTKRKLNRDEYAKKCGVSKMAISKAVRSGRVIEDDAGRVDTVDPVNRAYLQADHTVMKRAKAAGAKAGRGAKSKAARSLLDEKTFEQTRQARENANWTIQRRAKDLELLVLKAKERELFSVFGATLKILLLDLPRRLSVQLFGLARSKGATPMAIEGALSKALSAVIVACKEKARSLDLGSDRS